jgi:hypothetical protein
MRAVARIAALILPVLVTACSSSGGSSPSPSPSVPVGGAKSDLAALDGRWEGEYSSPDTGRTGSIVFEFKGGTGAGDVLMMPKKTASANPTPAETLASMPQILEIRFVSAEGGELSGQLLPYTDPDCNCQVTTAFKGRREGAAIRGTFSTARTAAPDKKANGTWIVQRSLRPAEKAE